MNSTDETPAPQQEEMPFAIVQGTAVMSLPKDLYIPPDALEVFLAETFEGPLDLLLYLIRRQNLDILDLPIAEITHQYMEYVDLMKDLHLELAGEYLLMAAMLAEIKSRMLLPRPAQEAEEEGDPRAELVRRLQEYERYKQAAEDIDELPRVGRDVFPTEVAPPDLKVVRLPPSVDLKDVLNAFKDVMQRAAMYEHHHITEFTKLFKVEEGRGGVVVTLLAILELIKQSLIELVQTEAYGPIHVKAAEATRA